MSAASTATRASERRRSSRASLHATTVITAANASDRSVTRINVTSISVSPKPEFDRHLHHDVDRSAEPFGRREPPLTNRLHCPFVQTGSEALQHLHVADRPVAPDDDLEYDLAGETPPACFFRVVRLDLAQEARRRDPAAGPIRSAANPAARSRSDSGSLTLADAGPGPFADATATAGTVRVALDRCPLENADAIAGVGGRRDDRRDDGR